MLLRQRQVSVGKRCLRVLPESRESDFVGSIGLRGEFVCACRLLCVWVCV
jgi:hypothetical protein